MSGRDDAPPLVLLHGGGANSHWWDHLAPDLAADFRVIALDFRGHGDSEHPDELLVGGFDRDLEGLLEHLGTRRVVLLGHSLGAHVAIRCAASGPGPRALVAVEPSRGGSRSDRRRLRLALAARRTYADRDEAERRFQFLPSAPDVDPALRAAIARHSVRPEADGRFGYKFDPRWFGIPRSDPPDPSRIAVPTLVVRGADSRLLTAAGAAELAGAIAGARMAEIAGAGHNVHLERPAAFLAALQGFLRPFR